MLTALLSSACSTSRQVSRASLEQRTSEQLNTEARDSVRLELRDSVMETKTITITKNEAGDTLRLSVVTERDRIRDRAQERSKEVEIRVVRDTVFIEKRDSVSTTTNQTNGTNSRASPFVTGVKWLVVLVCSIIVLLIIIRFAW